MKNVSRDKDVHVANTAPSLASLIPVQRASMTKIVLESGGSQLASVWSDAPVREGSMLLSKPLAAHPTLTRPRWEVYRIAVEHGEQIAFARLAN